VLKPFECRELAGRDLKKKKVLKKRLALEF